jgi:hypothetical protein
MSNHGKESTNKEGVNIDETQTKIDMGKLITATAKVLMSESLHTPNLRSNLISVSKLVSKGSTVNFEGNSAQVKNSRGETVLTTIKQNSLYIVLTENPTTLYANTAQSKRKLVPYDIWHRQLGHISTDVISRMVCEKLVDGLEASREVNMRAKCEDCIYRKHTTHTFDGSAPSKTEVLKRVYIDIWEPAPVQSAGGARYFMLLVDGAISYRRIFFLSSKSANTTLKAFQEFHVESE